MSKNLLHHMRNFDDLDEVEDFGGSFQPTHQIDGVLKMKTHSQIDRNKKKPKSERIEKEKYYDDANAD